MKYWVDITDGSGVVRYEIVADTIQQALFSVLKNIAHTVRIREIAIKERP